MATINKSSVFATGPAGTSGLDSLTLGNGSLWAEYGNGVDSTGADGGSSTIVQYSLSGQVEHSYSIKGSVDGLKIDPSTGLVWALQNQDGNSTLSLIDPATQKVTGPLSYAVTSATRGYDDVVFQGNIVYESYTNPTKAGDPVVQMLVGGDRPAGQLSETTILAFGATGTNIADGKVETIPLNDPDSLKSTPGGGLVLTSGNDNTIVLISDPGTAAQSERFVTLTGLPAGSSVDDVIIPTSSSGTFTVSNAGTNQIEQFTLSGLNMSDAYASVGSEIVKVDLQTGATSVVVAGLSSSHGMIFTPASVAGPVVQSTSIFAVGSDVNGTQPDSVTTDGSGDTFIEYGNGADSTGKLPNGGSSTIVEYDRIGRIEHSYAIPGEADGLKYDPATGKVWALHNQDANSSLYLIDPKSQTVSGPLTYAAPYVYGANSARGYDDVAFSNGQVFLSYTNPVNVGDSVVQILDNGNTPSGPLTTTSILRLGDTGTNLTTGAVNQALPVADPDSLKALPGGTLMLTSDHDAGLTFIHDPGTTAQTESFVQLPAGNSGLDDAIIPTSASGMFTIANGGANDVLKVNVTGLNTSDIYLALGSENAVVQIDPKTGAITPVITGLNSPHGMMFVPSTTSSAPVAPSLASLQQSIAQGLQNDFGGNTLQTIQQTAAALGSSDPLLAGRIGQLTAMLPDMGGSQTAALPLTHIQQTA